MHHRVQALVDAIDVCNNFLGDSREPILVDFDDLYIGEEYSEIGRERGEVNIVLGKENIKIYRYNSDFREPLAPEIKEISFRLYLKNLLRSKITISQAEIDRVYKLEVPDESKWPNEEEIAQSKIKALRKKRRNEMDNFVDSNKFILKSEKLYFHG